MRWIGKVQFLWSMESVENCYPASFPHFPQTLRRRRFNPSTAAMSVLWVPEVHK